MAQPNPPLIADRPTGLPDYRPLSVLALASFVIAAVYAAAVLVLGLVAFFSRSPLVLNAWTLVFPVLAGVLAVLARLAINRSEGTRTGAALAKWGGRLSLVFGLVYLAYYLGAYLAVSIQADNFTRAWFDKVREGKINAAFLDTVEPLVRLTDNPDDNGRMLVRYGQPSEDGRKPALVTFQENELVRLLRQGGPDLQVKSEGVKNWEYKNGGYELRQTYRLTTPEGKFEVRLPVRSQESKDFDGRRWSILWKEAGVDQGSAELTELGQAVQQWTHLARGYAADWLNKRKKGQGAVAYLETRAPQERAALEGQYAARLLLAGLAAGALDAGAPGAALGRFAPWLDPELGRLLFLPGYRDFARGGFLSDQHFLAPQDVRAAILQRVKELFLDSATLTIEVPKEVPPPTFPQLPCENGRLRVLQEVEVLVLKPGAHQQQVPRPKYRLDGALLLESDAGPITATRVPTWRVVGFELLRGVAPPDQDKGSGQPGGPGAAAP
jgi:hypothetical protein